MAKVIFKNESITIDADINTTLLNCIKRAKLQIETPCSGMGICGKCKVIAVGDLYPPTDEEKKFIDESKNERLACLAKIKGNVEVELIKSQKN
ncbi:2Fe-2S iron-sulfur cluster-binding protein [Haloimpatiens sp. FM7330]|uniref:2Fe-2S iron-sulfur cluster-binding protein n=1 Tax=Haloimpatiens sp. FM7330 TaxID=3298610 RepID=UPI00362B4943